VDADTFRGVHARLPELGAAVLEATQKLMKHSCGMTAAELAQMYNAPSTLNSNVRAGGPEENGNHSMFMRSSLDFFSAGSAVESRNSLSLAQGSSLRMPNGEGAWGWVDRLGGCFEGEGELGACVC